MIRSRQTATARHDATDAARTAALAWSLAALPAINDDAPATTAESRLGHWLALVSRNRQLQLERAARKLRLTSTEWVALRQLHRSGRTTQCRLADDAGITAPSLSRALSSLEELGYVTRQVDQDDLRLVRVDITDAGRALVPRLLDTERRVDRELFGCLEQVARDGLAVALHAVAATHGLDGGRARRIG